MYIIVYNLQPHHHKTGLHATQLLTTELHPKNFYRAEHQYKNTKNEENK